MKTIRPSSGRLDSALSCAHHQFRPARRSTKSSAFVHLVLPRVNERITRELPVDLLLIQNITWPCAAPSDLSVFRARFPVAVPWNGNTSLALGCEKTVLATTPDVLRRRERVLIGVLRYPETSRAVSVDHVAGIDGECLS